jgi:hypothetical protein
MKSGKLIQNPLFTKIGFMLSALLMQSSFALASGDDHATDNHAADNHGADYKHSVGVFLGATRDVHDNTLGTVGIEYEYKLKKQIGIGVVYEFSPEAHDNDGVSVYGLAAYWHAYAGWRLGLGAGKEKLHGSHGHTENLVRASITYDFHVGGFDIAPTFALDRVSGETIEVFGVAFNKAF